MRMSVDRGALALVALGAALLVAYSAAVAHGPALTDEYVYLAGARHFAQTGRLDARFYDADAILQKGYPHQDVHTPGYVILLGAVSSVFGSGYATAVALNAAAYLASTLLVRGLSRALGFGPRGAWAAGALYLVLPAQLSYVFWAMAELPLGVLVLLTLYLAARFGRTVPGAVASAAAAAATLLVRESIVFVLPAVFVLLSGARRRLAFAAAAGVLVLAVYVPLGRDRAPGGANFWAPTGGEAFGFEAVQAAAQGRLARTAERLLHRTAQNAREVVAPETTWTERGFLASFVALVGLAAAGWPTYDRRQRQYVAALLLAWLALVAVLFGVYVVVRWSGFRYMMFLMPAFLPPALAAADGGRRTYVPLALGLAGLLLLPSTAIIANAFKVPRLKRADLLDAYLRRYVDVAQARRIVLPKGFSFGYQHYPLEVITTLPSGGGGQLRALERAVDYDYLMLPAGHELSAEYHQRQRYRLLNGSESDPPYEIYQRLK
jgi:hypothetical protein